jgi:site-specific DNA-adenine methylase
MTIKPIYRIAGSKYRLLKHLTPHLQDCDTLVDVFGGSGIVSVNLKVLGVKNVIFNNYDKIDFFSDRVLINNILSFGGYGSITKLAGQNLSVRVRNGY